MRRFHLALAAILARVAGFGKNVVPFLRLWIWGGFPGISPHSVKCLRENSRLGCWHKFGDGWFHKFRLYLIAVNFVLRPVVKPMNPGEVAFGEQLRLGLQPVLHIAPGPRTLVQITEVSPSGHFVR